MKRITVKAIESPNATHKVTIFRREDGTLVILAKPLSVAKLLDALNVIGLDEQTVVG